MYILRLALKSKNEITVKAEGIRIVKSTKKAAGMWVRCKHCSHTMR